MSGRVVTKNDADQHHSATHYLPKTQSFLKNDPCAASRDHWLQ